MFLQKMFLDCLMCSGCYPPVSFLPEQGDSRNVFHSKIFLIKAFTLISKRSFNFRVSLGDIFFPLGWLGFTLFPLLEYFVDYIRQHHRITESISLE